MTSELIMKHRENAEVYHEMSMCKKKVWELLESLNLPKGLLPLDNNITEVGHNKATGFLWLLRKNKKEHVFKGIGGKAYFDTEVTTVMGDGKMKQITGVKTKELLFTFTVREIYITDPASGKITFAIASGITKAQPRSAFELEEGDLE